MKVFFFHIGTPTPVFETELELIRKHQDCGDSIRVMQCSGRLPNCHWNPTHDNAQCAVCRSRFRKGWEVLRPGANVQLKQFPSYSPMVDQLPQIFGSVDDIKRFRHDRENIGYGVVSSLVSYLRDHRFDTKAWRKEVLRGLRTAVHVYETLKQEIQEFRPDRVYFFNGRIGTHLPAYLLCKKLGIEFFCYEAASKSNSYRILEGRTVHEPISAGEADMLRASWTPEHQRIAESNVRGRRLGKQAGNIPVFTAAQVAGRLPKGFDQKKKNVAIFNSTIDEYAGVEDRHRTLYAPDETAGIRRILETFEPDDRFMFYLRVHPHMKEVASTTSQLVDIRELSARFRNVLVVWPGEEVDSYALMDACEKVITFGSTVGIEATYWGRPSILAARAIYENFNCVYWPRSHAALVELLQSDLAPLPAESTLPYFYWEVSNGIPSSYFRETGVRKGRPTGTFDGVEITAGLLPSAAYEVSRFLRGAFRALCRPSTAWVKLKQYAKTIY